jgi:lipid-A-disaccharide synthase
MARELKIYIIAGEASGDLLGAHLMAALKKHYNGSIRFFGVGGDKMTAEGLASLFPYQELSMMGFVEILPYAFNISARIRSTVEDIKVKHPDIVVTIDSPGFNTRVVKSLRKSRFKTKFIHYVAPTVWAYKPERAQKFAALFDHLMVLLPFEPPYFEKVGLPCTFVGHAAVAETRVGDGAAFRAKYDIANDVPLYTVLPGSRKGEVERHMPVFARALTLLAGRTPNLAIAVAAPKHVLPFVAPYFEGCPFRAVITANEDDKKDAFAASRFAIVKSGTVALEVAMAGTPMIIAYRVNPISAWAFRRMTLTKYVNLINILMGREIIPELLQEHCTATMIAGCTSALLDSPERMALQKQHCKEALGTLIPPSSNSPSEHAAQVVLSACK